MKRTLLVLLGIVVVGGALAAVSPAGREELQWRGACHKGDIESYRRYLTAWPEGRQAAGAKERIEDLRWEEASGASTVDAYTRYVEEYPAGRYLPDALAAKDAILQDDRHYLAAKEKGTRRAYEDFLREFPGHRREADARRALADLEETQRWEKAQRENTGRAYQRYLADYPDGRFAAEASARRKSVLQDDAPYLAAAESGTRAGYVSFLEDYPGHAREAEARRALEDMDGRDVFDLAAERKVDLKATGSGIEEVTVEIRRRVKYTVTARLPVGSYFVSRGGSAQNMVTTSAETIELADDEWHTISLPAACADLSEDIPSSDDTFTLRRSPHQADLRKLMPFLDESGAGFETRQAAVWIVTDNADYDDLGTLVGGFGGFGERVIFEEEAAAAMKIVDEAGIDITKRAIWWDRKEILEGLDDEDLKSWLRARSKRR